MMLLLVAPARSLGVDPGAPFPSDSEVSDTKLGSVLIFNVISSSASSPNARNTELSITNHHETRPTAFRLFFVEGATGAVSRSRLIFLAPNQVVSLPTSVVAPGLEGYAIAVALDGASGCPVSFNHLSGRAAVKLDTGHQADLGAEAVAALYTGTIADCTATSTTATLALDGVQYNQMAATVAIDSFDSAADGNDTLLVLNRIGGDLTASAATLGIAYEAATSGGTSFGFGTLNSSPQFRRSPATLLDVPAGETAWLTAAVTGGVAGAVLSFNANAGSAPGAFTSGHNLHRLALGSDSLVVPVLPATPGSPYPASSEASDNRAGSVLVFPFFTSSATSPTSENAALTLTNTHDTAVDVRLFFVSGTSGAVNPLATMLLTLPPHAPRSVPAGAVAPGFRGHVIAVAVAGAMGCPIAFNHLIGDVDVKLATGHFASLPATAVAALFPDTTPGCGAGDASLHFDGVDYNRLPRGLALDHAGSGVDGNFTLFVLDRLGGDLNASLAPLGTVNGAFFDDTGAGADFTFDAAPQFLGTFDPGVPTGSSAWLEAYPEDEVAMVGSTLLFNANAGAAAAAFRGGHNLHVLTLASDTLSLTGPPAHTPTVTSTAKPSATRTATPTLVPTTSSLHTPTRTTTAAASPTSTPTTAETSPTPTGPTPTGSLSPSPTPTPPPCPGDCNGDGVVPVNELIIGVNILLDSQPISACPAFDRNDTGTVTIEELIQGVNSLLDACPM